MAMMMLDQMIALRYDSDHGGQDVHIGDLCGNGAAAFIVTGMPIVHAQRAHRERFITLPVAFSHCSAGRESERERTTFIAQRATFQIKGVQHGTYQIKGVHLIMRGHGCQCKVCA